MPLIIVNPYVCGCHDHLNVGDFDTNNLEVEFNKELEQANTWLTVNKISLNVGKTK